MVRLEYILPAGYAPGVCWREHKAPQRREPPKPGKCPCRACPRGPGGDCDWRGCSKFTRWYRLFWASMRRFWKR